MQGRDMKTKMLNSKGFTLVEMLIALVIGILVILAILQIYSFFLKTSVGLDEGLEVQLEAKTGAQRIVKEMRAAGCYYTGAPIVVAGTSVVEFESDIDPNPTKGPWKIKYEYNETDHSLMRSEAEWGGTSYGAYSTAQELSRHITALTFQYYDETNVEITAPVSSQANRDLIRRVAITMTATTDEINPATKKKDSITVQVSVFTRCLGVNQSSDTTECALPTGLGSTDPSVCGQLNLSWTKSSSSDAAGYRVFYRANGASAYTGVFDVPGGNSSSVTITGLKDGTQYDVAMKCYDTSGNINAAYAGPITGTATPDTKPDDATAPELPTNVDATADDGSVRISWDKSISSDVGGYNIYRSDDGGTTYTKIKEVDSNKIAYTNTLGLTNCPEGPYYYKVTAWDCAGNEADLATVPAVYGDAGKVGGITDVPNDGTTSTWPKDVTAPDDPTSMAAVAGADKIYLSHTTPAADVEGTRLLRRSAVGETPNFPTGPDDSIAVGPNGTKDYAPQNANQTYPIIDSDSIVIGTTYYYTGYTYDKCSNYSPGLLSQATAKPCGDGAEFSKHYGPPLAPASLTSATCSYAELTWPASIGSEKGTVFDPISESDVVGYNIYRGTASGGPYTKLNTNPVTSLTYSDATVVAGTTYYYVTTSVDCADKESSLYSVETVVKPNGIAWDSGVESNVTGSLDVPSSQQNVAVVGLQVLGNSDVIIDSATISWSNSTAYIKEVVWTPDGVAYNPLWNDTMLPLSASGTEIDFSTYQTDPGKRTMTAGSTGNEMVIEFRDVSSGGYVDMRGATLTFTINYTASSDSAECASSSFSITLPTGPVITSVVQDQPTNPTPANLATGINVVTAGTQDPDTLIWTLQTVNVSADMQAEFGTTIPAPKLYYNTTTRTTPTAPTTDYSATPTGWTAIDLCQVGTSNTYQTVSSGACTTASIPPQVGKRVWYYIHATDNIGNADIEPEPAVGIYTYDQKGQMIIWMWAMRTGGLAQGEDVYTEAFIWDNTWASLTGVTVAVDILNKITGITESGTMTEGGSGYYYYPNTGYATGYNNANIDVDVTASKATYMDNTCSILNMSHAESYDYGFCD